MAYWGQALVLGPNINAPMEPKDEPKALELVQKAVALKAKATPRERAYIDALAARYTGKRRGSRRPPIAPTPTRWRKVVAAFPDDLDARTLYAESLMDLRPWNYWTRDGVPYAGDARRSRRRSSTCSRATPEPSRARCTCGFTCGSRPTRPSGPRPKPIACCR